MQRITLASSSPRRRAMLADAGFDVRVLHPAVSEEQIAGETPLALVERLARAKAKAVETAPDEIVVAGDTVVVLDGEVLGKPRDADAAVQMLLSLSGREHEVIGGWCVRRGGTLHSGAEVTRVAFRDLRVDEIANYVLTGEPLDKAGAYGIQERGAAFVARVDGSTENVVGLPLTTVLETIRGLSANLGDLPPVVAPTGDR